MLFLVDSIIKKKNILDLVNGKTKMQAQFPKEWKLQKYYQF